LAPGAHLVLVVHLYADEVVAVAVAASEDDHPVADGRGGRAIALRRVAVDLESML
jgi:hypothetical protein